MHIVTNISKDLREDWLRCISKSLEESGTYDRNWPKVASFASYISYFILRTNQELYIFILLLLVRTFRLREVKHDLLCHVANKWCIFSIEVCGTLHFVFSPGIFLIHILNWVPHGHFFWSKQSLLLGISWIYFFSLVFQTSGFN